ncbi:MAG: PEP-CTERM sorting domain-containing protein [Pirellulales bacterium]
MLRRFALSLAVLLSLAVTAQAASVISAGIANVITLQPDMAVQQVQFMITSPDADPWAGMSFRIWVEDGGTLTPHGGGDDSAFPNITDVDILDGTIFGPNNTGEQAPLSHPLAFERATTTTSGSVEANGLLATVTFDTTGFNSGSFRFFLDGVDTVNGMPVGFAPTTNEGSVFPGGTIPVPEPTIPDFFTLLIDGIDPPGFPGDDWDNPILPDNATGSPPWIFTDVEGGPAGNEDESIGLWFDPIITDAVIYETDGNSNFLMVGLPPLEAVADADGVYQVRRGSDGLLVEVAAGDLWDFDGVPQTQFIVYGINPHLDGELPNFFPTLLSFDENSNTFTMTPVPEPSSLALAGLGVLGLVGYRLRRRSA